VNRPYLIFAAGFALLATSPLAQAETFPSRPVTIIAPHQGGPSEFVTRIMKEKLEEKWQQTVIVDVRPGAGGNIGADATVRAKPDGYTLMLTASPTVVVNQHLYRNMPFDAEKDLAPISLLTAAPLVLYVNPKLNLKSFADFISLAKSKPGALRFGSSGVGTTPQLAAEMLAGMAGIKLEHVPYKTVSQAVTATISGEIEMFFGPTTSLENVKAGQLVALAQSGSKRLGVAPDLPTIAESGYPDYLAVSWTGLFGPRDIPPAVLDRIEATVHDVLRDKATMKRFDDVSFTILDGGQKELKAFVSEERQRWGTVIKAAGIQPQ
jgi:tripartite-type tricarboxylate transporter receptor subunit TctC